MTRGAHTQAAARRDVTAAKGRARESGTHVLVVFHASWCRDSAALERLFEHALVAPLLAAGFEVVRLDVGNRDRHLELARSWGLDYAAGIPAAVVLDPDGRLVGTTRAGELASATTLTPMALVTLLHPWLPEGVRGTGS